MAAVSTHEPAQEALKTRMLGVDTLSLHLALRLT
jgi:hypothetical protein